MRSGYEYPALADRSTVEEWQAADSPDIRQQAGKRVKSILSSHYPQYIDSATDARIRAKFSILLAPEDMRAGSGRW
jgi:trimethylamine--corrinoid protein Co-methyltransferase